MYYRLNIFKIVTILPFLNMTCIYSFYSYLHDGSYGYFEILIFEKKKFFGWIFKNLQTPGGGGGA
jgi:hypothetical protein